MLSNHLASFDEEAELARRARDRDGEAWATIYDRYHGVIYRYVLVRLRDEPAAEDIAAQCFVKAIAGIGGYAYRGKPMVAWLYRIAGNLIADYVKQARRHQPETAAPTEALLQLGPETALENIDLRRALDVLKRNQRDVVILRFYMSLSIREVASILGKSEAAVHSLQVRALETLRKHLSR
jgi:RNA polymerase sigma-70 factor (ECF subfamily)